MEEIKSWNLVTKHPRPVEWKIVFVGLCALIPVASYLWVPAHYNDLITATALACVTLVLWTSRFVPIKWSSAGSLLLMVALHLLPAPVLGATLFSSPVLVIAAGFVLAEAVYRTGLASVMADYVVNSSQTTRGLALKLAMVELASALVIPNVAVRVTLIIPVLRQIRGLSAKTQSLLIVDAGITSVLSGSLTLTSSSSAISSQAIIHNILGVPLSFLEWMRIFDPLILVLWAVAQAIIVSQIPAQQSLTIDPIDPPRLSKKGRRAAIYLLLVLCGWVFGPVIGLSLAWTSVLGALLLLLPRIGVVSLREGRLALRPGLLLFYIASLSLPTILIRSGAATFITGMATHAFQPALAIPFFVCFAGTIVLLRLVFSNSVTLTAILLPIVSKLAAAWHFNALVLSFILIDVGSFGFMLPAQSPAGMIAAESGQVSTKQFLGIGVPLALTGIALACVTAFWYWPRISP